jgi:hypothetical protein
MGEYLTREQMEKLTTKRLLAYKKKKLPNSFPPVCKNCRDCACFCCDPKIDYLRAYDTIKDILSKRGNL